MADPTPKELKIRYDLMKAERTAWDSVCQELRDYFVPNKNDITTRRQQGTKRTEKLYDSTGLDCSNRLSAAMQGNLTPAATKWFYLKMRDPDLNEDHETRDWLEDCAGRMRQAYNQSNQSAELGELYPDTSVFGTGCIFQDEKPKVGNKFGGLTFKTYGPGTYCIDEDIDGMVDTLFREFKLSARVAQRRWPEGVKGSRALSDALRSESKKDKRFSFLQCVFPRENFSTKRDALARDWRFASIHLCLDDLSLMDRSGYREFPACVPRWSKSSDEWYGRGLGHISLPDVKTLNRAKELGLKAWAKELDPPVKVVDGGVIGNVRLTPGGQTVVRDPEAVQPLDLRIRQDANRYNLEELKASIRAMWFTDQLRMKDSPQMTAEEVRARMDLMHRVLGPTLGRLEKELLNRMIERTFAIMLRAGALKDPPQAVLEAYSRNEADIDVEYEGPLARAQRNGEAEAISIFVGESLPLIEAGVSDALDCLDIDKAQRHKAKILGVPESVMASEQDAQDKAIERGKAQEAAANAEQGAMNAKAQADQATADKTAAETPPPALQAVGQ